MQYLRSLAQIPFIGYDVVEVAPQYDSAGQVTALFAAQCNLRDAIDGGQAHPLSSSCRGRRVVWLHRFASGCRRDLDRHVRRAADLEANDVLRASGEYNESVSQ